MNPRHTISLLATLFLVLNMLAVSLTASVRPATAVANADAAAVMFRGDPARTGFYPGKGPNGPPSVLRRIDLGARSFDTPGVGDGIAVLSSGGDTLYAYDLATGAERWRAAFPASGSSPLIANGLVYIGSWGEGFQALDATTGEQRWVFKTGDAPVPDRAPVDSFASSAAIADGVLYVGEGPYGALFALDPMTGAEHWRFDVHGGAFGSPAIAGGGVYIASEAKFASGAEPERPARLYAVDAATGAERWHLDLPAGSTSFSTPAVADGVVVTGASDPDAARGFWLGVDAATGKQRWSFEIYQPMWWGAAAIADSIAVVSGGWSGSIWGLDLKTGAKRWTQPSGGNDGQPVIADGVAYALGGDGTLVAVDLETGDLVWNKPFGAAGGSPVLADGKLYLTSASYLYVLGDDGDPSAISVPAPPTRPLDGPGGTTTTYPGVKITHVGPTAGGWELFEPTTAPGDDAPVVAGPLPMIVAINGCCNDVERSEGLWEQAILGHLAMQGAVVVAPNYHYTTVMEESFAAAQEAIARSVEAGHTKIDVGRSGVIGHSFGGSPSILYAATAEEHGLPPVTAVYIDAGCEGRVIPDCILLEPGLALPSGIKILIVQNEEDFDVTIENGQSLWAALDDAGVPLADRDFVQVFSDYRGLPVLIADHDVIQNDTPVHWYGTGKLSDALFACAFRSRWCDYALGNTPEQRFMGTWSNGTPVKELAITDDPGGASSTT